MEYDNLITHIQQRLAALGQEQERLENKQHRLQEKLNSDNRIEITAKLEKIRLALWERRGMQKAYQEMWEYVGGRPIFKVVDPEKNDSRKSETLCPKCSGTMAITTTIDAAPQPGYIIIASAYRCSMCGYHDRDEVCLPKEIALQKYNLEQLMKGV